MQFLLLICLMIVCLPIDWPMPPRRASVADGVLLTAAMAACLIFAAGLIAFAALRGLARRPRESEVIGKRYRSARTYFFFAQLAGFAVSLWWLGWGWCARQIGTITWDDRSFLIPFGELLILAPFLLVQVASLLFFFCAERGFHRLHASGSRRERFWTWRGYVLFFLRQQLVIVFAPLFLLMTQQGLERLYPESMRASWLPFASLLVLPAFLVFFPLILPPLLGLKRMPEGPARARLEANARRLRFRYSQIYFWDTRGGMANAMIVGIVPWLRYVVFTDRLLEELTEDEVDGVFGHEVGHAHYGHILYYGLFLILSFVLMGAIVQAVRLADEDLRKYRTLYLIAPVALVAAYMFAVFGFISRRCERQADVFGCRAVSCEVHHCPGHDRETLFPAGGAGLCTTGIAAFIRALKRVEDVNDMNRPPPPWRGVGILGKAHYIFRLLTGWLYTWQHSTISKRTAFLERVAKDPALERRFQFRIWALKWAIALGLIGALVGLGMWRGWSVLWLAL
jgi:Zn-dependent protease with chaperone function